MAAGRVGNPKKTHFGMEPDIRGECGNKFDVDGYVLSRKAFDETVPDRSGKRWAREHPRLGPLESQMRAALARHPDLAHLKKGPDGFEILIRQFAEKAKLLGKGPIVTLILGG